MTSRLINRKAVSKRTPVTEDQARFFAALLNELIDEYRNRNTAEGPLALSSFFAMPTYRRFLKGAYACGFVCRDFSADFPLDEANLHPVEKLGSVSFVTIRHYMHTLIRAERWGDGYSSPIRTALDSHALELVSSRLADDLSLYQ